MSYTFKMDLPLLPVFSAYFLMSFVVFHCEFIFIWKLIYGNFLRPVLTVSSSREDLGLLSPSTIGESIGIIYPSPFQIEMFSLWGLGPCKQCGQTLTMYLLGKCSTFPPRAEAERDNFPCCLPLQESLFICFVQFILPVKIHSFLGPNLMFQFGSYLAWMQADAPAAGGSIIVYLTPEVIFKIFFGVAHAPTNWNKCRMYLCVTSEYQLCLTSQARVSAFSLASDDFSHFFTRLSTHLKGCFQYLPQQLYAVCGCYICRYVVSNIATNIVQVRSLFHLCNKMSRGKQWEPGAGA